MPHAQLKEGTKICSRKQCSQQGQPQPLGNFTQDRSRADGLSHRCIHCDRERKGYKPKDNPIERNEVLVQRELAAKKEEEKGLRTALQVIKRNSGAPQATQLEELSGVLMQTYGGVRPFAEKLVSAIDNADNPGHKIRGLLGIASIVENASKLAAANAQDLSMVSDEELTRRIKALVREIQNEGALEVEYTISPPDTDTSSVS